MILMWIKFFKQIKNAGITKCSDDITTTDRSYYKKTIQKNNKPSSTMDIFQLIGDFIHLLAVIMLVLKILANKNVIGTSHS